MTVQAHMRRHLGMSALTFRAIYVLLLLGPHCGLAQQAPESTAGARYQVIEGLLRIPAPPPNPGIDNADAGVSATLERWRFVVPPGEDAPLEALGRYWTRRLDRN